MATVSANGKVTGISLGVTTIIAESEDTRIKWRVKVKGVDEEVDDIDNTVIEASK